MERPQASELLLGVGLVATLALTVARGLAWPNDWAEAQWLFSYEAGFTNRALPGTLLLPLLALVDTPEGALSVLRAVTGVVFGIFLCALLWLALRVARRAPDGLSGMLCAAVLLGSPWIVMSAHTVGYFDQITGLLSILAVLAVLRGRSWTAGALLALALLVNETVLFVGAPSVAFVALACRLRGGGAAGARAPSLAPLVCVPAAALAALLVSRWLWVDADALVERLTRRIAGFGFVEHGFDELAPRSYNEPLSEAFARESQQFRERILDARTALAGLPALAVLAWATARVVRERFAGPGRALLLAAFTALSLLPLALHAVAWDLNRIWMFPIPAAFLALWGLCELAPREDRRGEPRLVQVAALLYVAVLHVTYRAVLMGGVTDRLSLPWRTTLYAVAFAPLACWAARRWRLAGRDGAEADQRGGQPGIARVE